jgi:hypothetical protein
MSIFTRRRSPVAHLTINARYVAASNAWHPPAETTLRLRRFIAPALAGIVFWIMLYAAWVATSP